MGSHALHLIWPLPGFYVCILHRGISYSRRVLRIRHETTVDRQEHGPVYPASLSQSGGSIWFWNNRWEHAPISRCSTDVQDESRIHQIPLALVSNSGRCGLWQVSIIVKVKWRGIIDHVELCCRMQLLDTNAWIEQQSMRNSDKVIFCYIWRRENMSDY